MAPAKPDEMRRIKTVTRRISAYDHDYTNWFTDDQLTLLYENNPHWAAVEKAVYGDLPEGVRQ